MSAINRISRRAIAGAIGTIGLLAGSLFGGSFLGGTSARAQANDPAWPTRVVKFIIPFGAGAGADIGARLVAERLQSKWGKAVIVENRPGGDGLVAIGAFMGANDDHVLMFASTGSFTVHPFQYEKLPYDFTRDLLPIARVSNTILAVGVSKESGITSLKDMVARMKAEPGKFNVALVPGITELVFDGFAKAEGVTVTKVPYRDIVQGVADLTVNRLQMMMASYAILQPGVQGGGVKALAVTGRDRFVGVPDLPTAIEAGVPSLEVEGLVGLLGPKTMSAELRERIGADVVEVTKDPAISAKLVATGQAVNPGGAKEFEASIKKQIDQVTAIAKLVGMKTR